MYPVLIRSFSAELEKQAVRLGTLQSYLSQRAAQGVGGASSLGRALASSGAQSSLQATKSMTGLQRYQLQGVREGGKAVRSMQRLPDQLGIGQTARATRQRVEGAVRDEAAGAATRAGGVPLSKNYEGYMTDAKTSYSPAHVEQVMGLQPGQHKVKQGPTRLMKKRDTEIPPSLSSTDVTAPSSPRALSDSGLRVPRPPPSSIPVLRPSLTAVG